jgi:DNA polymerase delta subunit 1
MELQILQVFVGDELPAPCPAADYRTTHNKSIPHSDDVLGKGVKVVLFCADERGETVAIHVTGWEPSALISLSRAPGGRQWSSFDLEDLARAVRGSKDDAAGIHSIYVGKALWNFQLNYVERKRSTSQWLRVRFRTVQSLRSCKRRAMKLASRSKKGENVPHSAAHIRDVCEHLVAPDTKFLDDTGLGPSSWLRVNGCVDFCQEEGLRYTHCRRELQCDVSALSAIPEREDTAPFTIASIDIECRQGADGSFPKPCRDPIICIGTVLSKAGRPGERQNMIHAMRDCGNVPDTIQRDKFECELAMLEAWRDDMVAQDVCVFIGYNLWGFDYKYMNARHNKLVDARHVEAYAEEPPEPKDGWSVSAACSCRFRLLSMFVHQVAVARPKRLSSAAMGFNELFEILCTGRVTLDLLLYVKTNYKRSRYTLNAIATEFIGDQKEEISHADIYTYYDGTPEQRTRYCTYCVQDCALPVQLMFKLSVIEDYVQSSRVQWTQLSDLVSRGQQIRVFNMLHHYAHAQGYVIDKDSREQGNEGYEGATVLSPTPGFYQEPVATLDFASLYPSIMRAHNLCYTTRWASDREPPEWLETELFEGKRFVTDPRFRGVLPLMLDDLLSARKATKKLMAVEKDPQRKALLDKKQQAQKVSANSVYGFTGACEQGMMPCADVAATTTGRGRDYIAQTSALVCKKYMLEVIYGDTDSVMVRMGNISIAESFKRAEEMAEFISSQFPPAIVLEFEKVYHPYLLKGKKRYVGCKYEGSPTDPPKMDCKGIEMVRRDNAPLARTVQTQALTKLVMENDPVGAVEAIRTVLCSVVQNTAPFSDYVITKAVGETYKNTNLAHVRVADKLADRGIPVPPGGRVEFVILRDGGMKLFERAEDADFAKRNKLVIDRVYYTDKQIMTPLRNLLGNVCDLSVMFDAALASLEAQNARSDKARAARRMGLKFTSAPAAVNHLIDEAERVVESLRKSEVSSPPTKRAKSIDGFLVKRDT